MIGYKYFEFKNVTRVGIVGRIETEENKARFDTPARLDARSRLIHKPVDMPVPENNFFELRLEPEGPACGKINITDAEDEHAWECFTGDVRIPDGIHALYLVYHGKDKFQMKELKFL